jgi:hypothetical protein
MKPQDVFTPGELNSLITAWQLKAGALFTLSMHDKGFLPDLDRGKMDEAAGQEGKALDVYLSRYNAALAQAGEPPVTLETLIASVTGGGLVKMTP